MSLSLPWRRGFAAGVACGILAIIGLRLFVNETTLADRIIGPLLVPDTAGQADAIVVMGAGVTENCVPNQNGVRRVLLAARLWKQQRAPLVLFTGGTGAASCPVSVAMARLARDIGVDERSILIETASRDTRENGERSAALLRGLGARRVLLVTDRLHMARSEEAFAPFGFEIERASVPIYEGHVDNVSKLASGAREAIALTHYRWRRGETPADGQTPVEARVTMAPRHPDGPLVVLGASYAESWELDGVDNMPVINRGVTGQQSFQFLERFDRDVVAREPRAVLIWGFINDIFLAAPQDLEAALTRIRDSYTIMIQQAKLHGIAPILASEVTTRPNDSWFEGLAAWVGGLLGKEGYQDRVNRHVLETNRWVADLAAREGLLLLDFQATLGEEGGRRRRSFTADDGSHITPAGYAALTAYARPILAHHLSSRPAQ